MAVLTRPAWRPAISGDWRLCDEPHELLDGESQDAKHQVAEYLIVSPHAYIIGAVVVFQAAVDPFGGGALVVAAFFGQLIVGAALRPRFSCTLSLGATPWFWIDDRNMTERPARSIDFRRIIGAVHEIVEIGHTLRGDLRQWDCDLTVMQRRRCQQTRHRNVAIGGVDVQLVADPSRQISFGVAFCADIAPPWKIGQHLGQCHRTLPFQPARFLRLRRRRSLTLAWPATFALGRGRCRLW